MQRVLDENVRPPVTTEITGLAPLVRALNQSSIDSLHKGELLALPILFLMLSGSTGHRRQVMEGYTECLKKVSHFH